MDSEPVYDFFKGIPPLDLPVVKVKRSSGDFTYDAWTVGEVRRYNRRAKVRRWFRSWWWPARIADLEAQIRALEAWD